MELNLKGVERGRLGNCLEMAQILAFWFWQRPCRARPVLCCWNECRKEGSSGDCRYNRIAGKVNWKLRLILIPYGKEAVGGSKRYAQGSREDARYSHRGGSRKGLHRHRLANNQRLFGSERASFQACLEGDRAVELFSKFPRARPGFRPQPFFRHHR